jgi:K+-sensing histidine kinase KdpD
VSAVICSSAIFSAFGAALPNYFFTKPIYSFRISKTQDYFSFVAFLVTSIAIKLDNIAQLLMRQSRTIHVTDDLDTAISEADRPSEIWITVAYGMRMGDGRGQSRIEARPLAPPHRSFLL